VPLGCPPPPLSPPLAYSLARSRLRYEGYNLNGSSTDAVYQYGAVDSVADYSANANLAATQQ
jgi:hypothetical protein